MASKKAITKALLRLDAVYLPPRLDEDTQEVRDQEYSRVLVLCRDKDLETGLDILIENYRPGEGGLPWFPAPAVVAGYVRDAARARVARGDLSVVQIADERFRDRVSREQFDRAMADAPVWLKEKLAFWKERAGI